MKIVYVSGLCTRIAYKEIIKCESNRTGQQLQKFGRLLVSGLGNNGVEVHVLSKLPVNNKNCKQILIHRQDEIEEGIHYHYQTVIILPVIRNLVAFFETLLYTLGFCIKNKGSVIICDPMLVMPFIASKISTLLCRNTLVGLLTDIPTIYAGNVDGNVSFPMRISSYIMTKADCYVFLTEKMNQLVNLKNKPYMVMEGMADDKASEFQNTLDNKHSKCICLYTGGIVEVYGLDMLVQAFCKAELKDSELHIYGGGSYADKLSAICANHTKIKYFGVRDNDFIVQEQMKVTLLINPRLTNLEYTEYSFPSKNMEYMASGTPTLTTNLSGMPKEYLNYVYLFNEETVEGMAKRLEEVLSLPKEELHQFGVNAKKWIVESRNNTVQMSRLINLLETMNSTSTN